MDPAVTPPKVKGESYVSRADSESRTSQGAAEILGQVAEIAADKLDWSGPLESRMRLVEDLRLDSIRLLTLAMEVEDRFRICLDESDESGITTVEDLVTLIQAKLQSDSGPTDG